MNELTIVQGVALLGWLILAGGALASFRLGWGQALKMALVWATIFATVALFFQVVGT